MATFYPPAEIITVATPHRGARLALEVDNLHDLAGNVALSGAYLYVLIDPFNWWNYDVDPYAYDAYAWAGVAGSLLSWSVQAVLQNVIDHADVLEEMYPENYGNSYLYTLNEPQNLAHEALSVPWRFGFAYQSPRYYDAGIFTLVTSDPDAAASYAEDLNVAGLNLIVDGVWLWNEIEYNSPYWYLGQLAVSSVLYLGYYGATQRDYWCEKTGSVEGDVCFPNDGAVPTTNEIYPGADNTVVIGPSHFSATSSDTTIGHLAYALRRAMGL
jgi:hypothetical protein